MSRPYYVQTPGLQSAATTENPRRFRKQLAYVDKFGKRTLDGAVNSFELTEDRLTAIRDETNRMISNGVRVFGPIGHSNSEDNNHATWDTFTTGPDEKGRFSLFAEAEPVDDKAAELVKRSDVSVYLHPDYIDGRKNQYAELVRHVAFTPKPVIPDLGPFTPIAASEEYDVVVVHPNTEENKMPLTDFAKLMGITLSEDASEVEQLEAFKTKAAEIKLTLSENTKTIKDLQEKLAAKPTGDPAKPPVIADSPLVLRLAQENWTSKIQALSPTHISPATAKKLAEQFCTPDAVKQTLALSEDGENTMLDRLISSLKENTTGVSVNGQTGPQGDVVELSEEILNDPKRSPLVSSAIALAEGYNK